MELKKFIKRNQAYLFLLGTVGAVITALGTLGFDLNIFHWSDYYKSLNTDSKIFLVTTLNFLFTLIIGYYILKRIPPKEKSKRTKLI
jgi:hypothetical protein